MRILHAEDNRDLSAWLARLLRRKHYVIDCVHDGEEAGIALKMQDYALVILDPGMPGVGGLAANGQELVVDIAFPAD